MKKKKAILKQCDIPIYEQKMWFGIAESIRELVDQFTSLSEAPDIGHCRALSGYVEDIEGNRNFYLFLPYSYTQGMLAHEAFHVVERMAEYMSWEHKDDEPSAYLLTYIVDKFDQFVKKNV